MGGSRAQPQTAGELEGIVFRDVQAFGNAAAKYGRTKKDSAEQRSARAELDRQLLVVRRSITALRAEERREARTTVRDLLYAKLQFFASRCRRLEHAPAPIEYESGVRDIIDWLERWTNTNIAPPKE